MHKIAKPFVKWAGGKNQLLTEIDNVIPNHLKNTNFTYIEPFVGGGVELFCFGFYKNIQTSEKL